MAVGSDFTINYGTKRISHASGTTRYTVNALYSWLQDTFDELGQLDDDVPMKANTPTEYEMINGWTFGSDADLNYLYGGSIKDNTTGHLWANFYTIGAITAAAVVYLNQNGTLIAGLGGTDISYANGHIDMLVKVAAASVDVDARNVTILARNLGDTYDHFKAQAPTTGGRNPVPLATAADLNNTTASGVLAAAPYTNIVVTFGAVSKDVGDGQGAKPYDVAVDCAGLRLSQVYEYLKYRTRRGEATTLNGAAGQFYTAANGAYTEVKSAPFGTFAGGKFFGARGVWLENYAAQDGNAFQLLDANGATRTPPITMSVAVNGVVAGDRVFVARSSAGAVWKTQFTIASRTATTIVVNEALAADIPDTGTIRVGDDRYAYTAISRGTKTFTVGGGGVSAYSAGTACYVPIVDGQAAGTSMSSALVYAADFDVIARVRKKGILPFEVATSITSVGASISAIRTTDAVVS